MQNEVMEKLTCSDEGVEVEEKSVARVAVGSAARRARRLCDVTTQKLKTTVKLREQYAGKIGREGRKLAAEENLYYMYTRQDNRYVI